MKHFLVITMVCLFYSACNTTTTNKLVKLSETQWINPIDSMVYIWVPSGSLELDTTTKIDISDGFWMSKTEVTVGQFEKFTSETGHVTEAEIAGNNFNWNSPGFDQNTTHPVVYLSVKDITAYNEWANCELPNQSEWIYAAHANANAKTKYFWGNEFDDAYVWYRMNAASGSRPVGTKLSNPWDLHDMIGNVYEFTTVCDSVYRTIGASWSRCNEYSSHIPGEMVRLDIGNVRKLKLLDCSSLPRVKWSDDTGFRCVIRNN